MADRRMAQDTENLLLEHLKALRTDVAVIRRDVLESKVRLASLEGHVALVHEDMAGMNLRMDGFSERLERLERRLELS